MFDNNLLYLAKTELIIRRVSFSLVFNGRIKIILKKEYVYVHAEKINQQS